MKPLAAKLSDRQRREMTEDREKGMRVRDIAEKFGVSTTAVYRVLKQEPEPESVGVLQYMESRQEEVKEIIRKGLTVMNDEDMLKKSNPAQISSALGKLIDVFADMPEKPPDETPFELPARLMGRAFVDIFRRIEPNRTYVFRGGRGSLKSSMISLKIVELLQNHPRMHACVVRKVAGTLKDSVYAQMQWAIQALGLETEFQYNRSPLEITRTRTGQKIYFRGVDEPTKLKGIKPVFGYIGILWKEELDQFDGPEEVRSVNQSVLRGGGESYDFSSYNPPRSRAAWVNKPEFLSGCIVHESTYRDVEPGWLGRKFLDDAEHLRSTNPAAYEHEYLGVCNGDGGNVFEYVEERTITDEEIRRFDHIYQGVDWGWYPDQYCFLRCHYDAARERIYLLDELYANKMPNRATAAWIQEKRYTDVILTCDSEEPKSVNDYRDMGLPAFGAVKGPGSVDYGFRWLQRRTLVIDKARTPNALREILAYEYMRDKDGNVIRGYPDGNDHAISALRYAFEPLFRRRGSSA